MPIFYLITIIFSLAGIIALIGLKIFELKTGKQALSSKLSASADPVIRKHLNSASDFFAGAGSWNARRIFDTVSHSVFHAFGTAGLFVSKFYSHLIRRVKSSKFSGHKKAVSFFLKNVAESKGEKKDM